MPSQSILNFSWKAGRTGRGVYAVPSETKPFAEKKRPQPLDLSPNEHGVSSEQLHLTSETQVISQGNMVAIQDGRSDAKPVMNQIYLLSNGISAFKKGICVEGPPKSPCPRGRVTSYHDQPSKARLALACRQSKVAAGGANPGPVTTSSRPLDNQLPAEPASTELGLKSVFNVETGPVRSSTRMTFGSNRFGAERGGIETGVFTFDEKTAPHHFQPLAVERPYVCHSAGDLWTPGFRQQSSDVKPADTMKTLVGKIATLTTENFEVGHPFDALLVGYTSLNMLRVWMVPPGQGANLRILMDEFTKLVSEPARLGQCFSSMPKDGTVVLGPYEDDGFYYRGVVVEPCHGEPEKVMVYFFDYGNTERLSFSDLYPLPDECNEEAFPPVGKDCKLSGVNYGFTAHSAGELVQIKQILSSCQENGHLTGILRSFENEDLWEIDLSSYTGPSIRAAIMKRGSGIFKPFLAERQYVSAVFPKKTPVCVFAIGAVNELYCWTEDPDRTKSLLRGHSGKIEEYLKGMKDPEITTPETGSLVCVKTATSYVRGQVKKVHFGLFTDVELFDFGPERTMRVACRDLHPLPTELQWPSSVLRCFIQNLPEELQLPPSDGFGAPAQALCKDTLKIAEGLLVEANRPVVAVNLKLIPSSDAVEHAFNGLPDNDVYENAVTVEVLLGDKEFFTELLKVQSESEEASVKEEEHGSTVEPCPEPTAAQIPSETKMPEDAAVVEPGTVSESVVPKIVKEQQPLTVEALERSFVSGSLPERLPL